MNGQIRPLVGIIGTGYVGLATGAGLAECGNTVICADVDAHKMTLLQQGILPIYEPGLEDVVIRNVEQERLFFTRDVAGTIADADIIFIAVNTPTSADGSANIDDLESVVATIGKTISKYTIIVTKSTVPVGTGQHIRSLLENVYKVNPNLFSIVSNPEFLREGSAVQDFLKPDRLVFGTESTDVHEMLCLIYEHMLAAGVPCIFTNITTAEIIKYASNAFLVTKLSFINEIANLCDAVGGNAHTVAHAMGLDHRISPHFLKPGPGFGGSCFPKDTLALVHMAHRYNVDMHTLQGAIVTGNEQKLVPINKLVNLLGGDIKGKIIAILGLAYKANTDDIRYSPAITVIRQLQELGAIVQAYDPKAMKLMEKLLPDVHYCATGYEAVTNAHAAIIMTEWEEFKHINIKKMGSLMQDKIVIDARNIMNVEQLHAHDFLYDGIGQGLHPHLPVRSFKLTV